MLWNWQQKEWPNFRWDAKILQPLEAKFLLQSGVLSGAYQHINAADKSTLTIDLLSDEALKTSEIEGEILNRDSVQSSIRRHFGLTTDHRKIPPAEAGIAEMLVNLYQTFAKPLTHNMLYEWHLMLTNGRRDLINVGRYRTSVEPMQVVSGSIEHPRIHFEAPPSKKVLVEMKQFISWFNHSSPKGKAPLPALTRAALTHLYFISIHPFEDGNGRISRALAEKALAQCVGQPTLIALSQIIQTHKKAYYQALADNNQKLEITHWLVYFANTILAAQSWSQNLLNFLIEKTKLYDRVRGQLNARQEKVLARVFREGPPGFKGGISAENYISITKTSRATATRDLQDLVDKGALRREGEFKSTRYYLNITPNTPSWSSLLPENP